MTSDMPNWRESPNYDYINRLMAPELAWEWLRRNGDYQRDYSKVERLPEHSEILVEIVRRRWGLQFPCPAHFHCRRDFRLLVA